MRFGQDTFPVEVPEHQRAAFEAAWEWLAQPGGAWTAQEKMATVEVMRNAEARPLWDRRPTTIGHLSSVAAATETLSPLVVDTVERVSVEAGAITREWATAVIDALGDSALGDSALGDSALGDSAFAELVAVCATVDSIDRACWLLGRSLEPLPESIPGEPTGERPEATVDIGAYLPAAEGFHGANVAKSLSVAPTANLMRLGVVRALYSGTRFGELRWEDGALSRPQVELIAARTSALNECFY